MAEDKFVLDPTDQLPALKCGRWAIEHKHALLKRYIDITRGARNRYLPPQGSGGACYIDLYAGPGRVIVEDTGQYADGSCLLAAREAKSKSSPFTECWIGDIDAAALDAHSKRLTAIGQKHQTVIAPAEQSAKAIADSLPPHGLHFAFLDPFSLDQLPFTVIESLTKVKKIDLLIHFSAQDLNRNLDRYIASTECPLDRFAPGWRTVVKPSAQATQRKDIMQHWLELIRKLDMKCSDGIELVKGEKHQPLYWLVFASRHDLAHKLWDAVRDTSPQRKLI